MTWPAKVNCLEAAAAPIGAPCMRLDSQAFNRRSTLNVLIARPAISPPCITAILPLTVADATAHHRSHRKAATFRPHTSPWRVVSKRRHAQYRSESRCGCAKATWDAEI